MRRLIFVRHESRLRGKEEPTRWDPSRLSPGGWGLRRITVGGMSVDRFATFRSFALKTISSRSPSTGTSGAGLLGREVGGNLADLQGRERLRVLVHDLVGASIRGERVELPLEIVAMLAREEPSPTPRS